MKLFEIALSADEALALLSRLGELNLPEGFFARSEENCMHFFRRSLILKTTDLPDGTTRCEWIFPKKNNENTVN